MNLMKPKSNYISPEQFRELIRYIPELHIRKWKDSDVIFSMKLAYYCALRYGAEVAERTKEDFDYQRKEVYLGRTKTRKEDYAAIPTIFIDDCQEYWKTKQPLEPILADCKPQTMYKWLIRAGEALNIDALTTPQDVTGEKTKLHIFRKSMLKDMVFGTFGKNANIGQAQSMARHSRATTTADYLRLDIEGSKEFWDSVN
jgi:integrase